MEKVWGILWLRYLDLTAGLLVLLPWCLRLEFDTRVGLGWLCCQVGQSGATLCVASRSRQAWSVVGLSFAHVRVGPVFPSFLVYHLPRLLHDNARLFPFFFLHHPPSPSPGVSPSFPTLPTRSSSLDEPWLERERGPNYPSIPLFFGPIFRVLTTNSTLDDTSCDTRPELDLDRLKARPRQFLFFIFLCS